jgi:uncharacterized protein (TIRG00374 family)
MANTSRRWLALKWIISLSLLFYIVRLIPFESFRDTLQEADWWIVTLSCLFMIPAYYFNSWQMYLMTHVQGLALSIGRIFFISMITRFYELFLPTYIAGGAIRWYHYARANNKPAEALASIVLNRMLEVFLLLVFGLGFWLFDQRVADSSVEMVLMLSLLTVLSVVAYVLAYNRRLHRALEAGLRHLRAPVWFREGAGKVLAALSVYEDESIGFHLRVLLLAVIRHLITIYTIFMLIEALALPVAFETIGWIRSIVVFAMLLPISVSGFGVREATLVTLMAPFGVDAAAAVGFSLLLFLKGFVFSVVGGGCELYRVFVMAETRDKSTPSQSNTEPPASH